MSCVGGVLVLSLLGEQTPSHADQRQAEFDQYRQRRQSTGDGDVEFLPERRIVTGLFRTPGHDLDVLEPEPGARVHQEGGLRLIGFDEGHLELGPGDLERDARQAGARADVNQVARRAEMLEENQAVVYERAVRLGHQPRPGGYESRELFQLRILH